MEWPEDKTIELIETYKGFPVLWNPSNPLYFNKIKKSDAWKEIAERMVSSSEECKKKIGYLLSSYRREKAKIKKSTGTGAGTSQVYTSHWFAFEPMNFLEDKDTPRQRMDTVTQDVSPTIEQLVDPDTNPENANFSVSPSSNPGDQTEASEFSRPATPAVRPVAKRKKTQQQTEDNLLEAAIEILKTTSDKINTAPLPDTCEVKSFCNFLCSKMLAYSSERRQGVQHSIYELLMKADRGYFDDPYRPSQFLSSSPTFSSYGHPAASNVHQPFSPNLSPQNVSQQNHGNLRSNENLNVTNQTEVSFPQGGTPYDYIITPSPAQSPISDGSSVSYDYM